MNRNPDFLARNIMTAPIWSGHGHQRQLVGLIQARPFSAPTCSNEKRKLSLLTQSWYVTLASSSPVPARQTRTIETKRTYRDVQVHAETDRDGRWEASQTETDRETGL